MDLPKDYIVYDLETTGLEPSRDQAVEIAAVRMREGQFPTLKVWLLKPTVAFTPEAQRITGITDAEIAEHGVDPAFAWREFAAFTGLDQKVQPCPLVGHNITRFDNTFVVLALRHIGIRVPDPMRCIDTAAWYKGRKANMPKLEGETQEYYAKRVLSTPIKGLGYSLVKVYEEMGGSMEGIKAHRAEADVRMTDFVFRRIIETQPGL